MIVEQQCALNAEIYYQFINFTQQAIKQMVGVLEVFCSFHSFDTNDLFEGM